MNQTEVKQFWQVELRAKSNLRLAGEIPYKSLSEPLGGGYREMLWPGCFSGSLRSEDIYFMLSHDAAKPLASTASGTLKLVDTTAALKFEVNLPDTQQGRDLYTSVKRGDFKKMSFGFIRKSSDYEEVNGETVDVVKEAQLLELSPVVWPAYKQTSIQARKGDVFERANEKLREYKMKSYDQKKLDKADRILNNRDWASHGEFCQAVAKAGLAGNLNELSDMRLQLNRAASGLNETVQSEGGHLAPSGFAERILFSKWSSVLIKNLLSLRVEQNTLSLPYATSENRTNGLFDGLQIYQVAQAAEITASFPQFAAVVPKMKKTAALCKVSDELLEDAALLERFLVQVMSKGLSWHLENMLINGNGTIQWLGLLNSPAKIRIEKEAGQNPSTIVPENIEKMAARRLPESYNSPTVFWIANQSAYSELSDLSKIVGAAGSASRLFKFKSGSEEFDTLCGIPVVISEHAQPLGTEGDLILTDLSYYLFAQRSIRREISIHLHFTTDMSTYRLVLRSDGMPILSKPALPKNGGSTCSSIVTLADRT